MVNSKNVKNIKRYRSRKVRADRYRRLISMGEISKAIISDLSVPLDATNRFINLALLSVGDGSQGRQFLLDSKQGLRETSLLLKRLNTYAKKMEEEIRSIVDSNGRKAG